MPLGMSGFELGQLGLGGLGGLLQGAGAGANSKEQQRQSAQQQLIQAILNQQGLEQSLQNQRTSNSAAFADRMPLGSEQNYARQQAMLSMIPQLLQRQQMSGPTDPAVASTFKPQSNPFQGMDFSRLNQTTSPDATARALTDRRTALAGIDPTATQHLRPLSDYGLDQQGVFNAETENRTAQRMGENQQSEMAMRAAAMKIYNMSEQEAQRVEKQSGFSWKSLLGPIAGIAASFIPGVGPWLAPLVGGGVGGATGGVGGAIAGAGAGFGGEQLQSFLNRNKGAQIYGQAAGPEVAPLDTRSSQLMQPGAPFQPGAAIQPDFSRMNQGAQVYDRPAGPQQASTGGAPKFNPQIAPGPSSSPNNFGLDLNSIIRGQIPPPIDPFGQGGSMGDPKGQALLPPWARMGALAGGGAKVPQVMAPPQGQVGQGNQLGELLKQLLGGRGQGQLPPGPSIPPNAGLLPRGTINLPQNMPQSPYPMPPSDPFAGINVGNFNVPPTGWATPRLGPIGRTRGTSQGPSQALMDLLAQLPEGALKNMILRGGR